MCGIDTLSAQFDYCIMCILTMFILRVESPSRRQKGYSSGVEARIEGTLREKWRQGSSISRFREIFSKQKADGIGFGRGFTYYFYGTVGCCRQASCRTFHRSFFLRLVNDMKYKRKFKASTNPYWAKLDTASTVTEQEISQWEDTSVDSALQA